MLAILKVLGRSMRSTVWSISNKILTMKTKKLLVAIFMILFFVLAYYCHTKYLKTGTPQGTNLVTDANTKHLEEGTLQQQYFLGHDERGEKVLFQDLSKARESDNLGASDYDKNFRKDKNRDYLHEDESKLNMIEQEKVFEDIVDDDNPDDDYDYDDDTDDEYEGFDGEVNDKENGIVKEDRNEFLGYPKEVLDTLETETGNNGRYENKPLSDQATINGDETEMELKNGVLQQSGCAKLKSSEKFDCHPEIGVNQETCLLRGCCWDEVTDRKKPLWTDDPDDTQAPVDVPWCYYPSGYLGYAITETKETDVGFRSYLMKNSSGIYPGEIKFLAMDVIYETDSIVHVKITDPTNRRYEVPLDVPKVSKKAPSPVYTVHTSDVGNPFELTIKRRGGASDQTIFSTKGTAPLMYSDQFLQLSSTLPSSYIYGLGEQRDDLMLNVNWTRHTLWARDQIPKEKTNLYGVHPFYMVMEEDGSSNGFFLLNSNAMDVVIQPYPAVTWRTIGGILDFYIFLGPTPKDVTRQYTSIIGRPFMPPYWSLGFHLCRWGYRTAAETLEAVEGMRAAGIPLDTQWNDIDYMRERKAFTTDPDYFGDQAGLVKKIHEYNMKYIVILDPGIASEEPKGTYKAYDLGLEMDIFIKNESKQPFVGKVWPGLTVFPDFTHPNTQFYWNILISDFLDEIPADGLWIDMNEISSFRFGDVNKGCQNVQFDTPPYIPAVKNGVLYAYTICPSAVSYLSREYDVHNIYGLKESIATYNALKYKSKRRPFVISRSTYSGQGHYGGHWLGDNLSTYHDMYRSISATLAMNLFGIPMVGADICGFKEDTNYQLCLRWHLLGAFYPFSRNHNSDRSIPQEPFRFDEEFSKAVREVYLTRYSLLPYLYTLFYFSHTRGDTVARPMFQEFPWDKNTYPIDYQFLWGSALLIVPVLTENDFMVKAYLPDKTRWFDFYTGFSYGDGPKAISMSAPFDKINLLVQAGTIIPLQDPAQTTTESRLNNFSLLGAYCSQQKGFGVLYWDDGESLDTFDMKEYNEIEFYLNKTTLISKVKSSGYRPKQDMLLGNITLYGVEEKPLTVYLNGRTQQFFYDSKLKVLQVASISPKVNLLQEFVLQMTGLSGDSNLGLPAVPNRVTSQLQGEVQDSSTNAHQLMGDNYLVKQPPMFGQSRLTNKEPEIDQSSFINKQPVFDQKGLVNQVPTLDKSSLTNKEPIFNQNSVTNIDPLVNQNILTKRGYVLEHRNFINKEHIADETRQTNQVPILDQSNLNNKQPVLDQNRLANKLPVLAQDSLTNKLSALDQNSLTNKLSGLDQNSLTNKLPALDQNSLTNKLSALDQNSLTNKLPVLDQNSLANNQPVLDQSRLANKQPVLDQSRLANNKPVLDQSRLANNQPVLDQTSETHIQPMVDHRSLINKAPVVDQNSLINQEPLVSQNNLGNQEPLENQNKLAYQEPLVNQNNLGIQEPLMSQNNFVNQQPLVNQNNLAYQEPLVNQNNLGNQEPLVNQNNFDNQEPLVSPNNLVNQETLVNQNNLVNQKSLANQNNIGNQESLVSQNNLGNQEP